MKRQNQKRTDTLYDSTNTKYENRQNSSTLLEEARTTVEGVTGWEFKGGLTLGFQLPWCVQFVKIIQSFTTGLLYVHFSICILDFKKKAFILSAQCQRNGKCHFLFWFFRGEELKTEARCRSSSGQINRAKRKKPNFRRLEKSLQPQVVP